MSSTNRNKLRRDIAARRDIAMTWIVRRIMSAMPSSTRKAVVIAELKQLDNKDIVYVFGSSLSNAMIRDLVSLRENSIAAGRREQADEKRKRAAHWDNVVALRQKP